MPRLQIPPRLVAQARAQRAAAFAFLARPNGLRLAQMRVWEQLAEDLQDEASEAAVDGNPQRAMYLERWAGRAAAQVAGL